MKILALDLGTKTGWALGEKIAERSFLYSGVQDFSLKRGESEGMRNLRFDRWLEAMFVEQSRPDLVVYEMPHHRGGAATAVLGGMVGILLAKCAEHHIEYTKVHSSTLKKYATGSGRASKEEMVKRAALKFDKPILDDNEADALHLWAYGNDNP